MRAARKRGVCARPRPLGGGPHPLLALLCFASYAVASPGDRQAEFARCEADCTASGCVGGDCVPSCAGVVSSGGLPLALRLLQWDCTADCRYRCMHHVELGRAAAGLPPLKYHGKWPFTRLGGVQEPASVALSLANLWAHCVGYARFRRRMTPAYPMRTLWAAYAALSVNAWVWSSLFHCRDTRPTEILDYFSADCLVVFTLFAVTVRAGRLFAARQWLPVAMPLICGLGLHFRYMLFTLFDYGFNVKARAPRRLCCRACPSTDAPAYWDGQMCVAAGAVHSLILLAWSFSTAHPRRVRLLGLLTAAHAASLLEVLDFPPLAGIADAHALWHAATPLVTLGWYSFLADDCEAFWPDVKKKR